MSLIHKEPYITPEMISNIPRIYRFDVENLPINSTWGSLYVSASQVLDITGEGSLLNKSLLVTFNNKTGFSAYTCFVSVDKVASTSLNVSLCRGTSGTVSGTFVVAVFG